MKHTSINLSDKHIALIAGTGKNPSAVIRDALDAYFDKTPSALELIREHEMIFHMPKDGHSLSLNMRRKEHDSSIAQLISEDAPHKEPSNMLEDAHNSHIDMSQKKYEINMSTDAQAILSYILEELRANNEPLLPNVAAKFNLTTLMITKTLKPYGVRTQKTSRAGIDGKYFTQATRPKIEEILQRSP